MSQVTSSTLLNVKKIVQSSNPLKTCIQQVLQGNAQGFRSLNWRILLGLLPVSNSKSFDEEALLEEWEASMDMRRNDFKRRLDLIKGFSQQPVVGAQTRKMKFGDSDSDAEDAVADNPLSNAPSSAYSQSFERAKLEATVEKDMGRLWSDDPFFEQEFVLQTIRSVLMLYCEEESELGYRQGMHELASFIVYILHHDADSVLSLKTLKEDSHIKETVEYICSSTYLLQDSYWVFRRLMDAPGLHLAHWYSVSESSLREGTDEVEITFVANMVQNALLRNVDSKLAHHLNCDLGIHATAYGIRWLRLLFLREFSFSNCARIWDCIFADYAWTSLMRGQTKEYDVSLSVVPHVAVTMLLFVRDELLESDFSYALRRLMRYPPVENIDGFISKSITRKYNHKDLATLLVDFEPLAHILEENTPQESVGNSANSDLSLSDSKEKREALGKSLAAVVESLEHQWFPSDDQTTEDKQKAFEKYLLAIAELKRIRDVLLGMADEH